MVGFVLCDDVKCTRVTYTHRDTPHTDLMAGSREASAGSVVIVGTRLSKVHCSEMRQILLSFLNVNYTYLESTDHCVLKALKNAIINVRVER